MTLQEFSTSSPGATAIKFFVDNRTIIAINVSSTACDGINTFDSLAGIDTLTVPINGTAYTFTILTRELKTDYYFFTVEEVFVPSLTGDVSDYDNTNCNRTTFIPSANDATFENSDYNATISNAVNTRLNSFFLDVNRIKSQIKPTNYDRILSGSADLAPIPDSNYTSIGYTNGRYNGSKTTSVDFGIDPAIVASTFNVSVYPINRDDNSICSQSNAERTVNEYLFSPSLRYKPSSYLITETNQLVDALETPNIRKGFLQKGNSGFNFDSNSTSLTLNSNPDIRKGDHLLIVSSSLNNEGINGNYEYLHVESVNYDSGTDTTSVGIKHQAFSKYGDTSSVTITSGQPYAIFNLFGDSIYSPNGGQIYRIADKKLYILSINKIFITDERGRLIYLSSTCTT